MEKISSLTNPKIKQVVRLRKRRERDLSSLFLIEGYRELSRAAEKKLQFDQLFFCPELFLGENEPALIDQIQALGATLYPCSRSVFEKISYREGPDGLLGVAKKMETTLTSFSSHLGDAPFLVIAEAIEKPGNLGTILRSADGVGADGVIVCDPCTDIYNPNVVRSSVGTLFTLPVIEEKGEVLLSFLREKKIRIVATSPHAKQLYSEADLQGPIAIVVGTEQYGLSQRWMEQSDIQVQIPMNGVADSLNVATATTILLYEVLRQRSL